MSGGRSVDVLQRYALAFAERRSSLCDPPKELGVALQPIVQPLILRRKPDQHAGWPTVPGDDGLLFGRQTKVLRQVILDLSQSHRPRLPRLCLRATLALPPW
jgi:hypothetical protein